MTPPADRNHSRRAFGALLIWTIFLLVVLLSPGAKIDPLSEGFRLAVPEGTDKVVHVVLFAFETLFLLRWWRMSDRRRPLLVAVTCATGLALMTEVFQLWVPRRDGDLGDFAADQLGVAVGAFCAVRRTRGRAPRLPGPSLL